VADEDEAFIGGKRGCSGRRHDGYNRGGGQHAAQQGRFHVGTPPFRFIPAPHLTPGTGRGKRRSSNPAIMELLYHYRD
jgi:hypothetical protein